MGEAAWAAAPGRVNLLGEHTDYHEGYVLPTVIPQQTHACIARRADRRVCVTSRSVSSGTEEFEAGNECPGRGWLDYVQGVTATLGRAGVDVPGLDIRIDSTVPVGAGVSSSAALEVSLLRAIRMLLSLDMDDVTIARIAQRVETEFVGAPVGIMDQMASSLGRDGEALFIDTRTLRTERLPLPAASEIAVIDSGVSHSHAGGGYGDRRRESFEAAALLGVSHLRDLDPSALPQIDALPGVLARRARHVVTENQRVLDGVAAMRAGDVRRVGQLFNASHASMRDDYETSTPEIDTLVDLAQRRADVFGARLTGGGFGGAVVLLVDVGAARVAADAICTAYCRQTGRRGAVLVPPPTTVPA